MRDNKEKLQAPDQPSVEALIQEGRDAIEKQDDGRIASVSERLEKEAHRVASAMERDVSGPHRRVLCQ